MDFIQDYTLKSLRLKQDKWNKLVVSDGQREYILSFIEKSKFIKSMDRFLETWYPSTFYKKSDYNHSSNNEMSCLSYLCPWKPYKTKSLTQFYWLMSYFQTTLKNWSYLKILGDNFRWTMNYLISSKDTKLWRLEMKTLKLNLNKNSAGSHRLAESTS